MKVKEVPFSNQASITCVTLDDGYDMGGRSKASPWLGIALLEEDYRNREITMSYSVILLADRTVLPLREGGTRSLKNPTVQLDLLSEILPENVRVYALVGFRREDVLNDHTDFLFISNPDSQVERLPASIAHCLKFIDRGQDLFLIEADSALAKGEIETISSFSRSSVFYSPCLSDPKCHSANFFIRSGDLEYFTRSLARGFDDVKDFASRLSPKFDMLELENPRHTRKVEKRQVIKAGIAFDQQ